LPLKSRYSAAVVSMSVADVPEESLTSYTAVRSQGDRYRQPRRLQINDAHFARGLQRLVLLVEVCRIHDASGSILNGSCASVNMAE